MKIQIFVLYFSSILSVKVLPACCSFVCWRTERRAAVSQGAAGSRFHLPWNTGIIPHYSSCAQCDEDRPEKSHRSIGTYTSVRHNKADSRPKLLHATVPRVSPREPSSRLKNFLRHKVQMNFSGPLWRIEVTFIPGYLLKPQTKNTLSYCLFKMMDVLFFCPYYYWPKKEKFTRKEVLNGVSW